MDSSPSPQDKEATQGYYSDVGYWNERFEK